MTIAANKEKTYEQNVLKNHNIVSQRIIKTLAKAKTVETEVFDTSLKVMQVSQKYHREMEDKVPPSSIF